MKTTKPEAAKRRFQRIPFDAKVDLSCADYHWSSTLVDLSLHGALIEHPEAWEGKIGDHCLLTISLTDSETQIHMKTSIVRIETHHIGLNCLDIDIDSITHLRRFVELNLGDPELLNREFGALGTKP